MVGMRNDNGRGSRHPLGATSAMETMLRPLMHLEATYRAFEAAERELVQAIGVPICVPDCGKCCAVTTPMVWEVEARFMVSWLLGEDSSLLQRVVSICDGWLLDRHRSISVYGIRGVLSREEWDRVGPEVDTLLLSMPCPFLTREKRCMIHGGRPLTCRAYGVTRMPAPMCPRPLSPMETSETRAHIGDFTPVGRKLHRVVQEVIRNGGGSGGRFLPTSLYSLLRPQKLEKYVADNLVATAKLVQLQRNPAILFQEELNRVWAAESAIVTPPG